jgi:hypothetical protein
MNTSCIDREELGAYTHCFTWLECMVSQLFWSVYKKPCEANPWI